MPEVPRCTICGGSVDCGVEGYVTSRCQAEGGDELLYRHVACAKENAQRRREIVDLEHEVRVLELRCKVAALRGQWHEVAKDLPRQTGSMTTAKSSMSSDSGGHAVTVGEGRTESTASSELRAPVEHEKEPSR